MMESTKTTRPKINRGKRWLFHCFKPENMNDSLKPKPRKDPLLAYMAVAEKEGVVLPTILSSALTAAAKGGGGASERHLRKGGKDGSFRRALRAALNETSLGKKIIRRRKTNRDNLLRSSSSQFEGELGNKISSNPARKTTLRTDSISNTSSSSSHGSPAFTSSSLASSSVNSSCSSRTVASSLSSEAYGIGVTKRQQQNDVVEDSRKGSNGSYMAVCVLLISLLVLIVWGKSSAILCTLIGFFVVGPRRKGPCNEHKSPLYEENELK